MYKILENREVKNNIIIPITILKTEKEELNRVTDEYIDISYMSKLTPSRVLSNLYPYKFNYFNNKVNSIEAAIQSLKYKDENLRQACYEYFGTDAVHLRGMKAYDWQQNGKLYTPLKEVDRFSEEYQCFLDELYFFAYQKPLYKNNLENSGNKMLDHTIGENNTRYTTLTRTEYISRLYALRYCAQNSINTKEEVMKILTKVRNELKRSI